MIMDETLETRGDEPSSKPVEDETYGSRASETALEEVPFHIPRD